MGYTAVRVERVGFEPTISGSRNRRIAVFPTSRTEHPAGIEPAHPAWQAGRLPLHHGCRLRSADFVGWVESSRPTIRSTSCGCAVGPEGLEPSPRWLRARDAAANTWIPFSARRELNPRLALIRGRLWPLSYGPVGPEGVEPPPYRLKGGYAAITPRPRGRVVRIGFSGYRRTILCSFRLAVSLWRVPARQDSPEARG